MWEGKTNGFLPCFLFRAQSVRFYGLASLLRHSATTWASSDLPYATGVGLSLRSSLRRMKGLGQLNSNKDCQHIDSLGDTLTGFSKTKHSDAVVVDVKSLMLDFALRRIPPVQNKPKSNNGFVNGQATHLPCVVTGPLP